MYPKIPWIYSAPYKGMGGFQRYAQGLFRYVGSSHDIGAIDVDPPLYAKYTIKLLRPFLLNLLLLFAKHTIKPFQKQITHFTSDFAYLCLYTRLHGALPLLHYPSQNYPYFNAPLAKKYVITIHGLSFLYTKEKPLKNFIDEIKRRKKKIDYIITVSNHAKKDIVNYFDIPSHKVRVIHNCVDREIFNDREEFDEKSYICFKYGIKLPYFLHISSGNPKKKVKYIIDSFSQKDIDVNLVLAGLSTQNILKIREYINQKDLSDKIKIISQFIPDGDLAMLYRQCLAFILTSLHESCPFVLLEAMSCGKLCIVSNRTSLPEIAGDAALYVDIENEKDLCQTLSDIYKGKYNLKNIKGISLVKHRYSPRKFAQDHIELYRELLE